ncbi:MAG: hypothetical protein QF632_00145 [Candidatus Woesearchaeota archaeon]|jgi:hypothetical protein|nr:hypothetical protein [Candidatus Woesearchaeota archaeon]MDP7323151.1 hypothetical protein [Candidatus Woesearchaeota archaeon]MDP7457885.1 hypothetical protein [Candidatus Woesearchaeota archaeon]|tara:strand:- start:93 stop:299 length:207 start_codon:yes stop_codon:yes gene_type:complete
MKIAYVLLILMLGVSLLAGCASSGYQSTGAASYQNDQRYVGGGCGVAAPGDGNVEEVAVGVPGLAKAA